MFFRQSSCVAKASLRLVILLPWSSECWDYMCATMPIFFLHIAYVQVWYMPLYVWKEGVHMHVHVSGQRRVSTIFLSSSPRQVSHWTWRSPFQLFPGSACLCLSRLGHRHLWPFRAFMWATQDVYLGDLNSGPLAFIVSALTYWAIILDLLPHILNYVCILLFKVYWKFYDNSYFDDFQFFTFTVHEYMSFTCMCVCTLGVSGVHGG